MQLEHAELEDLMFYVSPEEQTCYARSKNAKHLLEDNKLVFGENAKTNMKFCHLLTAAPFMYQTLSLQISCLQGLVDAIETLPFEQHTDALKAQLITMQNGCFLAQRVAQIGIDEAAKLFVNKKE